MDSTYQLPATGPRAGQQYLDAQGRRWSVQEVSTLWPGAGYCVLDLLVRGPGASDARFRMTNREFFTFATSGGLRMVRG